MDHQLFLSINSIAGKSPLLDNVLIFIGGDYFLYLFFLIAAAVVFFDDTMRKRTLLLFGSLFISRIVITETLKRYFDRPRPFEIMEGNKLIVERETGNSFPSGHATIYFTLAFGFWGTAYFWPFLALAVVGSMGRIFVGVHYPFDVLVGALVGALSSYILLRLFKNRISS